MKDAGLYAGQPAAQGLYDPRHEHDACGVGFVVNVKGTTSHEIVRQALAILINLLHRGACGCEVNTGDGAGLRLGFLPGGQNHSAGVVEGRPFGRHDERALGAIDQGDAEMVLELPQGLAGRRLGHEALLGAPREAPEADDVAVEAQRLQVHGPSLHH